MKTAITVT